MEYKKTLIIEFLEELTKIKEGLFSKIQEVREEEESEN